jgi:hypothetical protein
LRESNRTNTSVATFLSIARNRKQPNQNSHTSVAAFSNGQKQVRPFPFLFLACSSVIK